MTDESAWELCPFCEKDDKRESTRLDPSWELQSFENYFVYVDENGLYAHRHNTKDWSPKGKQGTSSKAGTELGEALVDLLVHEDDEKAKSLTIILMELGQTASEGKAAGLRALETALNLIGRSAKQAKPQQGQTCATCLRVFGVPDVAISIHEDLAKRYLFCQTSCPYFDEDEGWDDGLHYEVGDIMEVEGGQFVKAHDMDKLWDIKANGWLPEPAAWLVSNDISLHPAKRAPLLHETVESE